MILMSYRCKIVASNTPQIYRSNNIGFNAVNTATDEVCDYIFDASLVKAYRGSCLWINGVRHDAVWVELDNSHDVCFLGSFDEFDKYFTALNQSNGKGN